MKTPDPSNLTPEELEHPNPEEVKKSVIMKAIESLKQDMNWMRSITKSLKK